MQDFDFGRYYRSHNREAPAEKPKKNFRSKLFFIASLLSVVYIAGIATGVYMNRHKVAPAEQVQAAEEDVNVVANINNTPAEEKPEQNTTRNITEQLESNEAEYIILAKIYTSKEKAHMHGMSLLNAGLPVFLAESGQKTKVYVGPVSGKEAAWTMLKRVKSFTEFQGAIMYER